ncbi:class E sortase [Streptomyces sp. NBC_01471]|uniref:class E sortase n=1 Tax=Streptomyces sp. NBC_01471 TaxID=2903879 RepID=UPI00352DB100
MTALRPEQDGSGPAGASEPTGASESAGGDGPAARRDGAAGPGHPGREYDPLTDPLPTGRHGSPWFRAENMAPEPAVRNPPQDWYGREAVYEPIATPARPSAPAPTPTPAAPAHTPASTPASAANEPTPASVPAPVQPPAPEPFPKSGPAAGTDERSTAVFPVVRDDETVGLRVTGATPTRSAAADQPPVPTGGRAERRKAAKGRGRKSAAPAEPVIPAIPRTRMEARLAARALKDSPAVIASRAIGEIFISLGVLMLLFVTYQLWWTNVRAHQEANGTAHSLQDNWAKGGDKNDPGAFEPGQGFAIIHIPKLDVVVPIAEGVSKTKVLDRGMVGHYSEGKLKTAMPSAKTGNFALAGHRNTHGEPFRYINKLKDGDKVVVETQDDYYTYEVTSHLAQTSPSNVSVIQPVPVGSGFTRPGRYITLTTCTPEFTSTYRMVVWGKMVDERPRSKGMPEALTAG